ncbi:MAGUK p55 subfamily member 2 [Fasciola gigantica]|uniref:MAGUK p55 subfamily member 2 n=1 Tax=Fasciola gigantica TaxID=46835 RepID=A0A504Y7Y5_FASGI|nr:MAGUK p55 subfamily member 2 [Fasciola gigantica]
MQLKHCLELKDVTTSGSSQDAMVLELHPPDAFERNGLKAPSDLWVDLEQFVMQTRESGKPDAHELYDLLADPHIREVLVAYDDVANSCYYDEDFDLVSVYTESDSHRRRPASVSPVPKRSPEQNSVHDDSLSEIAGISDLRSAVITHNNRSSNNGPFDVSDNIDVELGNKHGDKRHSVGSMVKSENSKQVVDSGRRWRRPDPTSPHDTNEREPAFSKGSSRRNISTPERNDSLSRHGKTNDSDSENSLSSAPKTIIKVYHLSLDESASMTSIQIPLIYSRPSLTVYETYNQTNAPFRLQNPPCVIDESALSPIPTDPHPLQTLEIPIGEEIGDFLHSTIRRQSSGSTSTTITPIPTK